MKPAAFDYRAPRSLDEALQLIDANRDAKLLAGGQSLVPVLNFRLASPPLLVDLNRIGSLAGIAREAEAVDLRAAGFDSFEVRKIAEENPRQLFRIGKEPACHS